MSCHGVIFMQHWSKVDNVGEPCPVGRYGHAAVCLNYGEDQPQIFIFGGRDEDDVFSDGWILDVQSGRWREVSSLLTCCTVLCDTFHTRSCSDILPNSKTSVYRPLTTVEQPLCKGHSYVHQNIILMHF